MKKSRWWMATNRFDYRRRLRLLEGEAGAGEGGDPGGGAGGNGAGGADGAGDGGGKPAAETLFKQADVDRIVGERLKREQAKYAGFETYQKLGKPEELQARLTRLQEIERAASGRQDDGLSEQDRAGLEWAKKMGLDPGEIKALKEEIKALREERSNERQSAQEEKVTSRIVSLATGDKVSKDFHQMAFDLVSGVIQRTPELMEAFKNGDASSVDKAYEAVKPYLTQLQLAKDAAAAKEKQKLAGIKAPLKGGVQGEGKEKKPMTANDRMNAAWERFQEKVGTEA